MRPLFTHLLITFAVCGVTVVSYGFWYAAVSAKSAAVARLENKISTKTQAASRIASARATLADIADNEATVRGYFVPETGVVSFIDNLEAEGRARNAVVSVLSVATGADGARPTLMFSLTIKGSFDAVMRTVGAIEYSPYALSISAFSITKDDKNSWRADFNLLVGSAPASVIPNTL